MPENKSSVRGFSTPRCDYLAKVLLRTLDHGPSHYWSSDQLSEALKLFVEECEGRFDWLSASIADRDIRFAVDGIVSSFNGSDVRADFVTYRDAIADKVNDLWLSRDAFEDGRAEIAAQIEAGVLDVGWDSEDEREFQAPRGGTPQETEFSGDRGRYVAGESFGGVGTAGSTCRLSGMCFALACLKAGVKLRPGVRSVARMDQVDVAKMAGLKQYKVHAVHYSKDHPLNHMYLVDAGATNFKSKMVPRSGCEAGVGEHEVVVTSMAQFFNSSNEYARYKYYADDGQHAEFGADVAQDLAGAGYPDQPSTLGEAPDVGAPVRGDAVGERRDIGFSGAERGTGFAGLDSDHGFGGAKGSVSGVGVSAHGLRGASGAFAPAHVAPPLSVVDDGAAPGASNTAGGVVRAKKRVVSSKSTGGLAGPVSKSYRTVSGVMFNNADEMYQDKISREYAQEIIEELFLAWGVPTHQPKAAKFAEDLLFLFLVTTTASNKADYNKSFTIPVESSDFSDPDGSGELEVSFSKLSAILESGHGKTRRQFARAVADDQRLFLKQEENTFLLPQLATRVGCESQLAYLAFDGSTHCSNMTSREVAFTKTMESRNLFERDDVIAQGASDRLMGGMSGGVRSIAPR